MDPPKTDRRARSTRSVPRERQLSTEAARDGLYRLVNEMAELSDGHSSLERAVEVGPRGRGGAVLLPSVDAEALIEREAVLADRVEALQDEIEDLGLAYLVADRLEVPEEELLSVEDLAESVGRGHLATGG